MILVQLRDLEKLAVKTFIKGFLHTVDKDNSNDSTLDIIFTENKLSLDLNKSQENVYGKNISEPKLQL